MGLTAYLYIAVALAVMAFIGAVGYKSYSYGYTQAQVVYEAKIQTIQEASVKEQEREQAANSEAIADYGKHLAELQAKNDQLNSKLQENAVEASKDTDANRISLGSSSLRRLNSIQRAASGTARAKPATHRWVMPWAAKTPA